MKPKTVYKIRDKNGFFSKGGANPSFSKLGKVWTQINHLNNHFNQLDKKGADTYRRNKCEVVMYELIQTESEVTDVSAWIDASRARAEERETQQRLAHENRKIK